MAVKRTQAKKAKLKLPPHVVLKFDPPQQFVKLHFPTDRRDKKGRRIYLQISRRCVPETPERAKELVEQIKAEYRAVRQERERVPTSGEFLIRYLDAKRTSVATRTYEIADDLFRRFVVGTAFAKRLLPDIRTMDVQRLYGQLLVKGSTPATIRKIHTNLSIAFNQAVKWESIARNPCHGVLLPKSEAREARSMTRNEARSFIKACRTSNEYIIFEFALETAMRPGEYLALTWSDIDFAKQTVRIRHSVAQGMRGGGFEIKEPKTKKSRRTLGFSNELKQRLLTHRDALAAYAAEMRRRLRTPVRLKHIRATGANYQRRRIKHKIARETLKNIKKLDLVFPSSNGLPSSKLNLNRRQFKDVVKLAGLDPKEFSLYSLRHTSLSIAIEAGVDIKTVSQKAGHSGVATTLNNYIHVLRSMEDSSVAKLSNALYDEPEVVAEKA